MTHDRDEPEREHRKKLLKMQRPSVQERVAGFLKKLEAKGLSTDRFRVTDVKSADGGKTTAVEVEVSPEIAERLSKFFAIKIFDPVKDSTTINGFEVEYEQIDEPQPQNKAADSPWAESEHAKRLKPKSGLPDRT